MIWDMQSLQESLGLMRTYKTISTDDYGAPHAAASGIENAHVITSQAASIGNLHYPILDLDFPCYLIPSSTKDHYHLHMMKAVPWRQYKRLLKSLWKAGLIEEGYYRNSIRRGYSSARLPWIKKED